jgi:hypothetical protein
LFHHFFINISSFFHHFFIIFSSFFHHFFINISSFFHHFFNFYVHFYAEVHQLHQPELCLDDAHGLRGSGAVKPGALHGQHGQHGRRQGRKMGKFNSDKAEMT